MSAANKHGALSATGAPDVYTYHDYREFLRDQLYYLKTSLNRSTRKIALAAGVAGGYLSMVTSGSRRLSREQLEKLAPALEIQRAEVSYLSWLIELDSAESADDKLEALKKIQRFRQYRNMNPLEVEVYRYLYHWYHIAIRELAQLPGFKADAEWIQERLRYRVGQTEIKHALSFLVEHGFLKLEEDGSIKHPEKHVDCKTGVLKPAMTKFHSEMLHIGALSLTEVASEERNVSSFTSTFQISDIDALKRILDEAHDKIQALAESATNPEIVYHVGFLAFPLTNKVGDQS